METERLETGDWRLEIGDLLLATYYLQPITDHRLLPGVLTDHCLLPTAYFSPWRCVMPYYEYVCRACGRGFSEKRSFAEASRAAACPTCASRNTQKRLNVVAVIGGTSRSRESIPLTVRNGGGCGCGGDGCGCRH